MQEISFGEAEQCLGSKLKIRRGNSLQGVNVIDLGPSSPKRSRDFEAAKMNHWRHPIHSKVSSNSYASVPWDAVSRVKFRDKSELQ